MKKRLLVLILFSIVALWPFFRSGYFQSHDGEWMVIRFTAFHQALRSGQFPVRFVDRLNNNYGYPVMNFLYPLPFYAAEIPKVLGLGFVTSIKAIFVLSTLFSVLAMFWALKNYFNLSAALAGSFVYLFIPYRFVDIYVRGSLGENLAFIFPPLIFGSLKKVESGNRGYLALISLSTAALILSHNVIALFFAIFFTVFTIITKLKFTKQIIIAFILGIIMSSFFALPALMDIKNVRLSQIKVSEITDHLVPLAKLIIPTWGFDPNPNSIKGISTQFGIVSIFIFMATLFRLVLTKQKNHFLTLLLASYLLIFFLMSDVSKIIWTRIPLIDVIQFPWRLLSLIVFISAILAAILVDSYKNPKIASLLIIVASVISTLTLTTPKTFVNFPDVYYQTNEDSTTARDEYLPIWVKAKLPGRANDKFVKNENYSLSEEQIKPVNYTAKISTAQDTEVTVNTIYFPGWSAKVDGSHVPVSYQNPYGLINFKLPKGDHQVIINYKETPVNLLLDTVSLAGLIITGFFYIFSWRKQNS